MKGRGVGTGDDRGLCLMRGPGCGFSWSGTCFIYEKDLKGALVEELGLEKEKERGGGGEAEAEQPDSLST